MILANFDFSHSRKFKDIFFTGQSISNNSSLLLYKGNICQENKISEYEVIEEIRKKGIKFISELKGFFCAIYYNYEKKNISFFVDKYGNYELYFFIDDNQIIISDNINKILSIKPFDIKDIDIQAIYEFILFEYPILGKTFINKIKILPIGSIFRYDIKTNKLEKIKYFDYIFKINTNLTLKSAISHLERLFEKAVLKIKSKYSPETIFGLGLSGGMDSRVVAYYAKKYNLNLKTFIFGEKDSDAYFISKKISKLLGLDHYELGFKRNFYKFSKKSIEFNPIMNVLYNWYYAIYDRLPEFDILLTGYNVDNQFGSHLNSNDLYFKTADEFVNVIMKKYVEIGRIKEILRYFNNKQATLKIINDIKKFFINSPNKEFWQKKEEFNYKYRQRIFIKNNPSFNFLGKYQSISLFNYPNLIDFLLTIPFTMRLNRSLFYKFLKKKIPNLYMIRPERDIFLYFKNFLLKFFLEVIRFLDLKFKTNFIFKKSHKDISSWLSNYMPFYKYIKKKFQIENKYFTKIFNKEKVISLILKKKWNNNEIQLIFRLLTIKLFLDRLK